MHKNHMNGILLTDLLAFQKLDYFSI